MKVVASSADVLHARVTFFASTERMQSSSQPSMVMQPVRLQKSMPYSLSER
jgi:hypothetical protein